jgi:hypothetical protein
VQQLGVERSVALLRLSFCAAGVLGAMVILPTRFSLPLLAIGVAGAGPGIAGAALMGRASQRRTAFRLIAVASGLLGIGAGVAVR